MSLMKLGNTQRKIQQAKEALDLEVATVIAESMRLKPRQVPGLELVLRSYAEKREQIGAMWLQLDAEGQPSEPPR